MTIRLLTTCFLALFVAGPICQADPLDAVFAKIDAAAKNFKGVTADLTDTEHSSLVNSDDVNMGVMKLLRTKSVTRIVITWKDGAAMSYDGKTGKNYNPKTNTVDVFDAAGRQKDVEQYLLLGFGGTSSELKENYDVSYAGEENVNGQPASHLKLIPKSPDTRRQIKQADLWYGAGGEPVQQKFLRPSGDYKIVTYTNMKFGSLPEKELEIKLPKGVSVQKH